MCGAYFDDVLSLDSESKLCSASDSMNSILKSVDSPPAEQKCYPRAQHRVWLGSAISIAEVVDTGVMTVQPKESAVEKIVTQVNDALHNNYLLKSEASSLRGNATWVRWALWPHWGQTPKEDWWYATPPSLEEA